MREGLHTTDDNGSKVNTSLATTKWPVSIASELQCAPNDFGHYVTLNEFNA